MSILKDFRDFAIKGNVVDMAVGIIIGAAFGKVVSSLVADVIMPPIGLLLGGVDFKDLTIVLQKGQEAVAAVAATASTVGTDAIPAQAEVAIRYGLFIQTAMDFLIVALSVFVMVRVMTRMQTLHLMSLQTLRQRRWGIIGQQPAPQQQPEPEQHLPVENVE